MYTNLIKPLFIDIKTFVLDTLFPVSCIICEKEGVFLCPDCQSLLTKLEHQICIVCKQHSPSGSTHPVCKTEFMPEGLISFFDYRDEKVPKVIIKGKYAFMDTLFETLGNLIAEKIKAEHLHLLSGFTLTPIPLHKHRHRWRGFNQAELLCQTLSSKLNLPISDLLVRQKITKTQKDLKKEQRLKNVGDAFKPKANVNLSGQNIILVDDVTTTGATLLEAAKVLRENGAAKVICLTVARD